MKFHRLWVLVICACGMAAHASAQLITDATKDDWPTYNGDYSLPSPLSSRAKPRDLQCPRPCNVLWMKGTA